MNNVTEKICPVCGSKQLKGFFKMVDVPVHSGVLWPNRNDALNCPKGDIKLAFCPVCSYIMNSAFEPALIEYTHTYDSSLFFSHRFREYARESAESLIRRYNLHNRDIVSVGCGKGEFLILLCELGNNRGIGFDTAYVEQEEHRALRNQVKFIRDYYSERYAHYPADLIVCRQVLEHVEDPKGFLKMIRRIVGNRLNTHMFFEVPNAMNIFQRMFVWDIIYGHYSYFTTFSLNRVFSSAGFDVCDLTEAFEDQYLAIYAQPNGKTSRCDHEKSVEISRIGDEIELYGSFYKRKFDEWSLKLEQLREWGKRVVIWGTGSKGVTFLNAFKDSGIEYTVDLNPRKQGMYVPGTGQQIVSPDFLKDYQPDTIIIMNPIYKKEIIKIINKMKLKTNILLG